MTLIDEIMQERRRQDIKWGEQNHSPHVWMSILIEEVGEFAQAALQTQFGGDAGGLSNMRKEAIHIASSSIALLECLDRGKWKWREK